MNSKINMKGAAIGALVGGVSAGVLNTVVYFVANSMGADFKPRNTERMAVLPFSQPMIICLIAAVVSIGLLALLKKFAPARAWTIYLGIAAVVFLIEVYMPVWAFADMKTILALELMHVPATIGIIGGIYKMGLSRSPAPVMA